MADNTWIGAKELRISLTVIAGLLLVLAVTVVIRVAGFSRSPVTVDITEETTTDAGVVPAEFQAVSGTPTVLKARASLPPLVGREDIHPRASGWQPPAAELSTPANGVGVPRDFMPKLPVPPHPPAGATPPARYTARLPAHDSSDRGADAREDQANKQQNTSGPAPRPSGHPVDAAQVPDGHPSDSPTSQQEQRPPGAPRTFRTPPARGQDAPAAAPPWTNPGTAAGADRVVPQRRTQADRYGSVRHPAGPHPSGPGSAKPQPTQTAMPVHARRFQGGRSYLVEEGDTLREIARYELGNDARWREIYRLNRQVLADAQDALRPGMRLLLPGRPIHEPITRRPMPTILR